MKILGPVLVIINFVAGMILNIIVLVDVFVYPFLILLPVMSILFLGLSFYVERRDLRKMKKYTDTGTLKTREVGTVMNFILLLFNLVVFVIFWSPVFTEIWTGPFSVYFVIFGGWIVCVTNFEEFGKAIALWQNIRMLQDEVM